MVNTTRSWYTTDALGSVRAILNDSGTVQATTSYDAWGVPQGNAIAPFGFTGELQSGSDVWLRARWYGAGRGGFGGRDPFAGNAQQPSSMQYYQYGYSNPVSLRDPSGQVVDPGINETPWNAPCVDWLITTWKPSDNQQSDGTSKWNIDERSLSRCLRPLLLKYAAIHAQPSDGFDSNTLAIIMGAIIQMENGDPSLKDWFNRKLSNLANHTVIMHTSTSIVKMSPQSVREIYTCDIPLSSGKHYTADMHPTYLSQDAMNAKLTDPHRNYAAQRYGYKPSRTFVEGDNGWLSDLLEDKEFAVEMLAINLKRGIIRAKIEGLMPSVFNIATWHNKGVQHANAIRDAQNAGYGAVVSNFLLDRAARDLNIPLRKDVRRWNKLSGDPNDEFQFVEACLPRNCSP